MSVNQSSHFWYGAFTNSSLEIFDKVPVLETVISSCTQEVFPSTSLDESSIEFEFETDRNLYLDMRDTHLSLKLQLFKGRLFEAFSLYGRLAIDLFSCEKLLLPKTKVRIKLIRARPNFHMLSDNPNDSLKTVDCSLFTRNILVAEPNHQYLQWNLEREPAHYNYMETIARTFIIPSRQNLFIQENVFNNAPIRRIAVAMNTNSAVAGSFHEKLFNYQQFHLRELRIIRGGIAIISLDTTSPCRPYVTTMKAMQFNEDFPALPLEDIQNHYILVFNLTSLQDAAEHLHYPELSGESLRLEMFFQFPLEQVT